MPHGTCRITKFGRSSHSSATCRRQFLRARRTTRPPNRHWRPLRWLGRLRILPQGSLRPVEADANGQMSCAIRMSIRRDHPRLLETRSAADVHEDDVAFVYGSRWKQRYFTARATITTRCRRNGTSHIPAGCPTCAEERRLVGALYPTTTCSDQPGRCATAATQSITTSGRRASRSGTSAANPARGRQRACGGSGRTTIVNPARLDYVAATTPHPLPLARPPKGQSDRWKIL